MPKQLLIVESPAKAKTINKYLGKDFQVLASYGHVRDLVPKEGAVDPDDGFRMRYELIERNEKHVEAIAKAARAADGIWLATDPDREGEAISWHIAEILKERGLLEGKALQRVVFTEITPRAIKEAMSHPRNIADELVDAQQARRALDYLVGFNLSPVLWRKIKAGLSAGRVQSPALRMIVEREEEIEAFKALEYWTIEADCAHPSQAFSARLVKLDGQKFEQFTITDGETAEDARARIAAAAQGALHVTDVASKERKRRPSPPFTTSTLQQEAARKLGFTTRRTMQVAQKLYEGVAVGEEGTVGLITYMRTDSVTLSQDALGEIRDVIARDFGTGSVPDKPNVYQTKSKNAQEAHEAVRPTSALRTPAQVARFLSDDERRLYELVWKRTVASQMIPATLNTVTVDLAAGAEHGFRASGTTVVVPGFLAVYEEGKDSKAKEDEDEGRKLPAMKLGDRVPLDRIHADQHFTQPPPRYSEASLVKRLEELGIGRPSTYAATLQVLKDRNYVRTEKNRFFAEESGRLLTSFLERFFERYVAYDFTAGMEDELDDVSGGRAEWKKVLEAFWNDFKLQTDGVMERKPSEVTEALDEFLSDYLFPPKEDGTDPRLCPKCEAGRLSLRGGRYGAFVACSNYPECKYTRKFAQPGGSADGAEDGELGKHPETGETILRRAGRFGPYIQLGEGKEAKRSSIPKDIGELDLDWAVKLLGLPREVGTHPETGNPITASIGRYGPYLAHAGKYAKLASTAEVFDTGMNAAVAKLADAANGGGRGRTAAEPLKTFGAHPESGSEIKLMAGRYGPYVTDGTTNATLPRDKKPEDLTEEEAVTLITEKAAKGPDKKGARKKAPAKKAPVKKAPAKKAAATAKDDAEKAPLKKAPAKKAPAKKAPAKKTAAKKVPAKNAAVEKTGTE